VGASGGSFMHLEGCLASAKPGGKLGAGREHDRTRQCQRRAMIVGQSIFRVDVVGLRIGHILIISQLVRVIGVMRVDRRFRRQLLVPGKMCTPRHIGRDERAGDYKGENLANHGRTTSGFRIDAQQAKRSTSRSAFGKSKMAVECLKCGRKAGISETRLASYGDRGAFQISGARVALG